MADDLPNEFDLIVVGTGFPESIVASAASRIGKTVLHVDPNEFYGGQWASFNLENFHNFVDNNNAKETVSSSVPQIVDDVLQLNISSGYNAENTEYEWFVPNEELIDPDIFIPELVPEPQLESVLESESKPDQETESESKTASTTKDEVVNDDQESKISENSEILETPATPIHVQETSEESWTKERILKDSRKFNIDLTPKLIFGNGSLVQLLISSNIGRYAEFKITDKITTLYNGLLKTVPCSRADVFTTKDVNVLEKRLLMKVLSDCMNYEEGSSEFQGFESKTFRNYLESKKLTPAIIHYVLYAIAMGEDGTPCIEAVKRIKKFLSSLGRYGNTAFLFPMYGCGEIPQCFCRLCAVFGGVYCLRRPISEINYTENKFTSLKCGDQVIRAKSLVIGNGFKSDDGLFLNTGEEHGIPTSRCCTSISRAIYIMKKPLGDEAFNAKGSGVLLIKLPDVDQTLDGSANQGAFVIQLTSPTGTCPRGLYLLHISTRTKTNPKADIEPYKRLLFNDDTLSNICWAAYYNLPSCIKCLHRESKVPDNVHIACGPHFELDYDISIKEAKEIFERIYPGEEFLPRAPEPEDIIWDAPATVNDTTVADVGANQCDQNTNIQEKPNKITEGIENEENSIAKTVQNETQ